MTQNSVKFAANKQFCLHPSLPLAFTLTLCSFALYNPRHLQHGMKNYEVLLASSTIIFLNRFSGSEANGGSKYKMPHSYSSLKIKTEIQNKQSERMFHITNSLEKNSSLIDILAVAHLGVKFLVPFFLVQFTQTRQVVDVQLL